MDFSKLKKTLNTTNVKNNYKSTNHSLPQKYFDWTDETNILIDGSNFFIKYFSVFTMHGNGDFNSFKQMFFTNLFKYINKVQNINKCIIVFDGKNSTTKRKEISPEYKNNRGGGISKHKLFKPFYRDIKKVIKTKLPIIFIEPKSCEADDVIGYCANVIFKNQNNLIISEDKDFYQLVNDNTKIYSIAKKQIIDIDYVIKDFGFHPKYFLLYKSIVGDKSDNLIGVKGVGKKLFVKHFLPPVENLDKEIPELLIEISKSGSNTAKKHILENKDNIEINYKLMNISNSFMMSAKEKSSVKSFITANLSYKIKDLNVYKDLNMHMSKGNAFLINELFYKLN